MCRKMHLTLLFIFSRSWIAVLYVKWKNVLSYSNMTHANFVINQTTCYELRLLEAVEFLEWVRLSKYSLSNDSWNIADVPELEISLAYYQNYIAPKLFKLADLLNIGRIRINSSRKPIIGQYFPYIGQIVLLYWHEVLEYWHSVNIRANIVMKYCLNNRVFIFCRYYW